MPYSTPKTWSDTELVDEDDMNTYIRDQQNAMFPGGVEWDDWTPSYTNFTKGNATGEIARYLQVGDIVHIWYTITFGSTTTIDSSYPAWTLPVANHASLSGDGPPIGHTSIRDDSAAVLYGGPLMIDSDKVYPHLWNHASGSYSRLSALSASAPGSLTTDDVLSFRGSYEVA